MSNIFSHVAVLAAFIIVPEESGKTNLESQSPSLLSEEIFLCQMKESQTVEYVELIYSGNHMTSCASY